MIDVLKTEEEISMYIMYQKIEDMEAEVLRRICRTSLE